MKIIITFNGLIIEFIAISTIESMSLDLVLFRDDQGGNSGKMRDIQTKRFKDVTHVDKVVETDAKWRKRECHVTLNLTSLVSMINFTSTSSIPS